MDKATTLWMAKVLRFVDTIARQQTFREENSNRPKTGADTALDDWILQARALLAPDKENA